MKLKSTLLLGGARSGKSHFAQALAFKSDQPVLFVATAEPGDEEMRQRIEEHRKVRPSTWQTLEVTTHIGRQIAQEIGPAQTVIVDCVTLLVSNIFAQHGDPNSESVDASLIEREVVADINELIDCLDRINARFIIVTSEVGLGLVPPNRLGRLYRDFLGRANQMLAQRVDEVYLITAGMPLRIKPADTHG